MLLTFFPDKPFRHSEKSIPEFDNGEFCCQQKNDGHRMILCTLENGNIEFVTRHNKYRTKEVCDEIREQAQKLSIPPGSQIDGEWLARREACLKANIPEQLVLFDIIKWGEPNCNQNCSLLCKCWKVNLTYKDRFRALHYVLRNHPNFVTTNPTNSRISLVECATPGNFMTFWEHQTGLQWSEGIVLKRWESIMVASQKGSQKNPNWVKIKYRDGIAGDVDVRHLDIDLEKLNLELEL